MGVNLLLSRMASSLVSLKFLPSLQSPLFSREFSIFIHLLLFFGPIVSWFCKLRQRSSTNHPKDTNFSYHKPLFICSLTLSLYNLVVLCCLCYFCHYGTSWSDLDEKLVTFLDLALRAVAWLLISVYISSQFNPSISFKFPLLLRLWWGLYLVVSIYCFIIDIAQHRDIYQCLPHQVIVSDIVYVISGIVFCSSWKFAKVTRKHADLHEPLLNGNNSIDHEAVTVSPYVNAGFLTNLTFSWVGLLISKGHKKRLDLDDVPPLSGKDNVNKSYAIFKNSLEFAKDGCGCKVTTMQLTKSLILMTWGDIIVTGFFVLLHTLASYVGPYLIDVFVQYVNGKRRLKNEGYVLVSAFFVAKLVECLTRMHSEFRLGVMGVRTKAVLIESIYSKALTLSCQSKKVHTSGEMINFISVDAERIGQFSSYVHDPWMITLQVALALLLLYRSLGLASIAAFFATVLVMLVNIPLSTLFDKYEENLMQSKDRRMKATFEILKNMRVLKLQAWDMKFLSKMFDMRNTENIWLKKSLYTSAMMTSVFWVAPTFVSVVTFGTCVIIGIPLESGKILSTIATFRILQEAIYHLPNMLSMIIQTKVSLSRIASFFSLDDLDLNYSIEKFPRSRSEVAVEISGGNFTWDLSASSNPTLQDINIKVQHGMRIAVCGTVGSGKSTLLSCILGEVPKISGILRLSGSKAYVAQSPWIQSGKLVDNILFGQEMDIGKYNKVLEACSLKKDLEILSFGDQTIIGERGINLSGGQKQRIQIARALYQDADIYLFDDPFSALDAHTGSHLFKECVLGLLESKTVIYVTHQVEFLPAADLILVMKDGRILQAGTYNDILKSGTDFKELVGAHEKALSALDSVEAEFIDEQGDKKALEEERNDCQIGKTDDVKGPKGQLVKEEEREKGRVGLSVYWKYITTAYGGALVPFILLSQVIFQLLQILSNYWMASATSISPDSKPAVGGNTILIIYVALAIGSSFCILARATLLVTAAYKTATLLFSKMHWCIFRAPMSFFDAIPSGRILNRVSTDQNAVDMATPARVGGFAFSLITLLGTIVVMSQVAWQVYVIFIPTLAVSLWYQQYYLCSARELFRLVGVTKAPVIQHFSETVSGVATIRSFNQESRFYKTSVELINGFSRPRFYSAAAKQWLSFRLDMLSSVIFACFLIFLISVPVGFISPAGLAVTYALNLNMLQSRVMLNLSLMENRIISVERILQYTNIESEAQLLIEDNRPDPSWPSWGEVDVQELQIRYAPQMPLVLRGITCTFQGGKKTGIVGRTGCGKSTLIQALFRIVEPAAGRIIIDGVDISSIGLDDLRSKLSIIPQDPTMFEGTVRSNLDPLDEYTTHKIWEALDKCQLGDEIRKKEGKLDSLVNENGENWSAGQRQLLCVGRVLLKRSKILVLDEATASVDTATDNMIQQILREHFANSTVITIAHRITSVIDSDMVVLLSHGLVEECDFPLRLLEDQSSSFAKLVAEYTTRSNFRWNWSRK